MMTRRRFLKTTATACVVVTLAGCSRGPGSLKGTVAYRGRLIRGGTVSVMSDDGQFGSGEITPEGTYEIATCPNGKLKLFVASPNPESLVQQSQAEQLSKESEESRKERHAIFGGSKKTGGTVSAVSNPIDTVKIDPKLWFEIPEMYSNPDTSMMTVDVSGATVHDIDLQ